MSSRVRSRRSTLPALLVAAVLLPSGISSASAQSAGAGSAAAKPIGKFGDWQAFESGSGANKTCFIIARPTKRMPENLNRDPASFFITHRPGQGVKSEVSMTVGFPMKEAQDATVKVGSSSFAMYTKDSNAWVRNVTDEPQLVSVMRKGKALTFVGTSRRGNTSTDTYSLSGMADALDAITKTCK